MLLFTKVLKEFKMTISSEKSESIERPFITDISRAKQQIDRLIDDKLKLRMDELAIEETEEEEETEDHARNGLSDVSVGRGTALALGILEAGAPNVFGRGRRVGILDGIRGRHLTCP